MSTNNQYLISVKRKHDGRDFGYWKTVTGWGVDSPEVFARDVYGGPRRVLGGPRTLTSLTATKTYYPDLDDDVTALEEDAGHVMYLVARQNLTAEGAAIGTTRSRACMLKSVALADVDVGADDPEADTYTIELTPEG